MYNYYLGFFANGGDNLVGISIYLTSNIQQVEYFIEAPGVGYSDNGTVSVGNVASLNIPSSIEVSSYTDQDKGIYITATGEGIVVIGQSIEAGSSDSFFALPIIELGDHYVYYGISQPSGIFLSSYYIGSILIVGTENNTMIRLMPNQPVNISMNSAVAHLTSGEEYSFVINRLETFLIGSPEDLSGTKITTDRPVSVFSGHQCADVPWDAYSCDYLVEQIPPTALWGKTYYVAPLADKVSYTIKILAAYNSTTVNIYCNNTMESHVINEGKFVNRTSGTKEYCAIYSNKQVLVVQFSHGGSEEGIHNSNHHGHGDPMMTIVPATNQYLDNFNFLTFVHGAFLHYANFIVMEQYYQPRMIYLIGSGINRSLETEQWVPIQVNNTIEAYAASVRNIPRGMVQIYHTNTTAQMMAFAYGFAGYIGYGYIGGIHLTFQGTMY